MKKGKKNSHMRNLANRLVWNKLLIPTSKEHSAHAKNCRSVSTN